MTYDRSARSVEQLAPHLHQWIGEMSESEKV